MTFMDVNFSKCLSTYNKIISTSNYDNLCTSFKNSDLILLIGSGGNIAISEHMASDLSRHTGKSIFSPGSMTDFTIRDPNMEIQNPYLRWVNKFISLKKKILLIAISSSGTSETLLESLDKAKLSGADTWIFSGKTENTRHNTIFLDTSYYHEHEVTSMMLFYNIVNRLNCKLPKI